MDAEAGAIDIKAMRMSPSSISGVFELNSIPYLQKTEQDCGFPVSTQDPAYRSQQLACIVPFAAISTAGTGNGNKD